MGKKTKIGFAVLAAFALLFAVVFIGVPDEPANLPPTPETQGTPSTETPKTLTAKITNNWMTRQFRRGVDRKMELLHGLLGHLLPGSVQAHSQAQGKSAETSLRIIDKPIVFDQERKDLTLTYRRLHQDPSASDITIAPKMVILHWTAINSFDASWKYFNNVRAESARTALANAGDVNVSIHFLVDRDGTIYRLMPETWMARHCIGLNHVAIGVENVGDGDKFPLTGAQAEANIALVRYLKGKYPGIEYLIGHHEYRKMEKTEKSEGTPLFLELDPKYRNQKPDPGAAFMEKVRERVKDLELKGPREASPAAVR